jgi:hypothetical protein
VRGDRVVEEVRRVVGLAVRLRLLVVGLRVLDHHGLERGAVSHGGGAQQRRRRPRQLPPAPGAAAVPVHPSPAAPLLNRWRISVVSFESLAEKRISHARTRRGQIDRCAVGWSRAEREWVERREERKGRGGGAPLISHTTASTTTQPPDDGEEVVW